MNYAKRWKFVASSLVLCGALLAPAARSVEVGASSSQGVNITIYNQNFGLVRDIRGVELKEGINHVRLEDVAAQIDPTSVSLTSLTAPNAVTIREQNYQFDLMDPNTILGKSIGKNVKFRQFVDGQVREISGTLLNSPLTAVSDSNGNVSIHSAGLVVKTADGVILNPEGQIELAELPPGLVSKPSLLWKLECNKPGKHDCEIAYQTGGLNWKCDYVTISNPDDTKADITSWVTLDNKSGAAYKNAGLKLIAGDVHRVQPQPRPYAMGGMMARAAEMAPQFKEQSFAEYHLYSLKDKTDLGNNETKQLTLFAANNVPTRKLFIYEPEAGAYDWTPDQTDPQKVKIKLEVQNTEANQLGMPMPKGKVRVYKKDQDGALQFIGEDTIDHTPRGEKLRVYIGDAFDLVGERIQTNVQQINKNTQRLSYTISLRNHKDTDVTITSVEHAGGVWKIVNSSQPFTKKDSKTFEFPIKVPANGEVKFTYDIDIRS